MQNKQRYWGLALAAVLAVTISAGAQQAQQKQTQTKPAKNTNAANPAANPFDPCTGDGLPSTSQMAPFAPGSPSVVNPPKPATVSGGISCSNGKCSPSQKIKAEHQRLEPQSGPTLPLGPAAAKAAKENAFPEAKSEAAQQKAGQENAFPEAQSEAAQAAAQKAADQPPPQQGVYSSSDQRMSGVNALGNGPAMDAGSETHPSYDPQLAKKDDKIGKFYLQSGDWPGAYGRYKEATQVNPGDINAVFGLASAADHLGKRAQAIQNYKLYLAVLPNGPHSKDALRALKRLSHSR